MGERAQRRQEVDSQLDAVENRLHELEEWADNTDWRVSNTEKRTEFMAKGQKVVVEGSVDVEANYQTNVAQQGGGGWRTCKLEVPGVLAQEMAKPLHLTLGGTPPDLWTEEAALAKEEGRKNVALKLLSFYQSLVAPRVLVNIREVWKNNVETGEPERKAGNFKLVLDHGKEMHEIKSVLIGCLETRCASMPTWR